MTSHTRISGSPAETQQRRPVASSASRRHSTSATRPSLVRRRSPSAVRLTIPDAHTALAAVGDWMTDYNEVHPHSRLAFREYIRALSQPAECPV
jgi:hypothetical protein